MTEARPDLAAVRAALSTSPFVGHAGRDAAGVPARIATDKLGVGKNGDGPIDIK